VRVRALSIHADYACRHSGACCSSGWEIPVEPDAEALIRAGIGAGRLAPAADWAVARPGLPHAARVALRVLPSGDCVFLEPGAPRLCAVQHRLGEPAMPPSCRQFPRVATLTPLGVSVTLSHHCPTAAAMLFRDDVPLAIVTDPPAFPASHPYEGLDARVALPPLLRRGVLSSWGAHARLEEHAVSVLARADLTAEQALGVLAAEAEALRAWTIDDGDFDGFAAAVVERGASAPADAGTTDAPLARAVDDWERAAAAVPAGHRAPQSPRAAVDALGWRKAEGLVAAACRSGRGPVGRWLAAKAFASWLALQGGGVRTSALGLRVAHSVLRAELARAGPHAAAAEALLEAVRRADLLLVHLVDPQALARELSRCESRG
jgi:hypothetical protein